MGLKGDVDVRTKNYASTGLVPALVSLIGATLGCYLGKVSRSNG